MSLTSENLNFTSKTEGSQMNGKFNIDIHNLNLPLEYHEAYEKECLVCCMTY